MGDLAKTIVLKEPFTEQPMPAPVPLGAFGGVPFNSTTIDLSWYDTSLFSEHYIIQWSLNPGFTSVSTRTIAANPMNSTVQRLSYFDPGTTYYLRVKSTNSAGDSAWVTTSVTTP